MLDTVYGIQELRETFERVVLALKGNEQSIGRYEHVDCDKAERRWTVDNDEVIIFPQHLHCSAHNVIAVSFIYELDFGGCEIRSCTDDIQFLKLNGSLARRSKIRISDEHVVESQRNRFLLESDSTGGVALWVRVDQERALLRGGETGCEIYSGGRFPHTALLVCDCDYSGHVNGEDNG